jgi:hypothetical protein
MEPIEHNNVINSSSSGLIPLVELVNTTHTAGIIPPKVLVEKTNKMPVTENKTSTECLIDTNTSAYNNNFSKQNTVSKDTYKPLQGEITMAEVDTIMLQKDHADIRREAAEHTATIQLENMKGFDRVNADVLLSAAAIRSETAAGFNDTVKESIKGDWHNSDAIKDSRYEVATRVEDAADRVRSDINNGMASLTNQFFTVSRDTADLRAQVIQAIDTTKMATELNALKGIIEGQRNTTYLSDKISSDGERTRALINDLKYNDLNRELIDRNTALIEAAGDGRYWRHRGVADQNQAQFASLQSQLQAFNSQLTETRQGMVNFGTMAGVGQSSTSNNVR